MAHRLHYSSTEADTNLEETMNEYPERDNETGHVQSAPACTCEGDCDCHGPHIPREEQRRDIAQLEAEALRNAILEDEINREIDRLGITQSDSKPTRLPGLIERMNEATLRVLRNMPGAGR